jgi:hypothetical protein
MKKMIVSLVVTASAFAFSLEDRCWEVGVDYLYWKPCGCFEYGVDKVSADPVYLGVTPDYDSGFRLFAATYTDDCCHIWSVEWAHLKTTDHVKREVGSADWVLFPSNAPSESDKAEASLKYRYNKVNLRAGRYISNYCTSRAYAFGGLRYVDIERKQSAMAIDPELTSWAKAQFEGAAFEVGAGVEVQEPCNFSAVGHISGLAAIGRQSLDQALGDRAYYRPTRTTCAAGIEVRLGVQYRYECDCFWITAQVGYELDYYISALSLPSGLYEATGAAPFPNTTKANAGFGGPYLSLSARF